MRDPRECDGFHPSWNSFAWLLRWALEQFPSETVRYLEWGAGWSTTYVLTGIRPANVYSVEDTREWFDRYKNLGIHISLKIGPERGNHDAVPPTEWIDPFPQAGPFNVVLVDGHARRDECVVRAAELISHDGFVIVHDTWHAAAHRRAAQRGIDAGLKLLVDVQAAPGTMLLCRHDHHPVVERLVLG